ncbi:hypothetical protein RMQ97_01710 [Maricaulis sp. D1M11]|uniref:hypothetical protein n=1 Tax=Maricaulis sp. D1M11 TaxID=3076117 RepID=UPI0039B41DF8
MKRARLVLTGHDRDESLLDQGFALASRWDFCLDALFVRPTAEAAGAYWGDGFSVYALDSMMASVDRTGAELALKARDRFEDARTHVSADHAGSFVEFSGLPREAMAVEGRLSDLLIMAGPGTRDAAAQLNAIETAAMVSGRPVLVLPEAGESDRAGRHAGIAWDGSLEVSRAVQGGLGLLKRAERVSLLHAGPEAMDLPTTDALARYLGAHGLMTEQAEMPPSGVPGQLIPEMARALDVDLLVMGGFGAPGWQRSLGRDETTQLLRDAPYAILLAH